eukprot:Opistho-2@39592
MSLIKQGAEARIVKVDFFGREAVQKIRFEKKYRHPALDKKITHRRITQEAKSLAKCRKLGIDAPAVFFLDLTSNIIVLEFIAGCTVKDRIISVTGAVEGEDHSVLVPLMETIGRALWKMHAADLVHGDLTTSNIMLREGTESLCLIDFGLSSVSTLSEDKAVDLYVLERAFISTHPKSEALFGAVLSAYAASNKKALPIIAKLDEVRLRGRKRSMVG